jgi:hypothetical protein
MARWHHPRFMIDVRTPKSELIPVSCIESAEYIIQTFHNQGLKLNKPGKGPKQTRTPHVFMHFGGGVRYNISTEDLMKIKSPGIQSFDLERCPPGEGQGVAIFNVSNDDAPGYNMHFMAVLGYTDKYIYMSNLNEEEYEGDEPPQRTLEKGDIVRLEKYEGMWKDERFHYETEQGIDENGIKTGDFRLALLTTSETPPRASSKRKEPPS